MGDYKARNAAPHRRGQTKKVLIYAAAATASSVTAASSSTVRHHALLGRVPLVPSDPALAYDLYTLRGGAKSDDSNKKSRKKQSKSAKKENQDDDSSSEHNQNDRKSQSKKPQPSRIEQDILDHDDYYQILGISKDQVRQAADPLNMITKAYRRRCLHTHPDKTGDRRAFDKVAEAYHVLSDDSQRKLYDRYGKRGLQGGATGPGSSNLSAEDLFRSFFEGGPFRPQTQQPVRRNRTTRYQLEVGLPDLYHGLTKTVRVAPSAPAFFSRGHQPPPGKAKSVKVHIPRGTLEGTSLVLSGEVDFDPNEPPADIVFVIRQVPHPVYTRKGYDLAMTLTISLSQAICGFRKTITHLNGKPLTMSASPSRDDDGSKQLGGESSRVIQTGDVHVLKGQGMPKDETGQDFGDLYVVYKVEMPKSSTRVLTNDERNELMRLLNKLEGKSPPKEVEMDGTGTCTEPVYLKRASLSDFGRASGHPPPPPQDPDADDHEQHHTNNPFSSPFSNQFFFSSSGASSPFFGGMQNSFGDEDADDGNVQCQQM